MKGRWLIASSMRIYIPSPLNIQSMAREIAWDGLNFEHLELAEIGIISK